jgi:hypothetical protein
MHASLRYSRLTFHLGYHLWAWDCPLQSSFKYNRSWGLKRKWVHHLNEYNKSRYVMLEMYMVSPHYRKDQMKTVIVWAYLMKFITETRRTHLNLISTFIFEAWKGYWSVRHFLANQLSYNTAYKTCNNENDIDLCDIFLPIN